MLKPDLLSADTSQEVTVYRLVCRDTYEAQIFKIASLKSGLDEAILGQVAASGDTVADAKKIADLLKCAGRARWPP